MKTSFRASPEDLAVVDRRAHEHGLSRTAFLLALGCGRDLPVGTSEGLAERVGRLEEQMVAANKVLAMMGLLDGES